MLQYLNKLLICVLCAVGASTVYAHASKLEMRQENHSSSEFLLNSEEVTPNDYAYKPMLVDGKKWTVLHGVPSWGEFYIIHVTVSGDCVMDGKQCKKLIVNLETPKAHCPCILCTRWSDGMEIYAYEEDRKIYVYHNSYEYWSYATNELTTFKGYWDIYMDFSVKKGDKIQDTYEITDDSYSRIGEGYFRTLSFDIHKWIEGIGSPDLYNLWGPRYAEDEEITLNGLRPFYLWKCEENGKLIYDDTEYLKKEGLLNFLDETSKIEETPEDYQYKELFEDGKSWVAYHGHGGDFRTPSIVIRAEVAGDAEIDGVKCKKLNVKFEHKGQGACYQCMHWPDRDEPTEFYAYEKDRVIYIYRPDGPYYVYDSEGKRVDLKYGEPYFDKYVDLNVKIGDEIPMMSKIESIDYREIGGCTRRVLKSESWRKFLNYENLWIEGIGSNCFANSFRQFTAPDEPIPTSIYATYLVMCCQDGTPIYDNRELMKSEGFFMDYATTVEEVDIEQNRDSGIIYNLQGLPVTHPQKGCPYILNGKKIIF